MNEQAQAWTWNKDEGIDDRIEAPCWSLIGGGVLCRYWGEEAASGAALIAAAPQLRDELKTLVEWVERNDDLNSYGELGDFPDASAARALLTSIGVEAPVKELPRPCPFCGIGATFAEKSGEPGYSSDTKTLGCMNPQCPIKPSITMRTENWVAGKGTFKVNMDAKLIAAWNGRKEGICPIP